MRIGADKNYTLSSANVESIGLIFSLLEIDPPTIIPSSRLNVRNLERTKRILEICRLTGKRTFLTGWGAGVNPKVHDLQMLTDGGIEIKPLSRDNMMKIEPDFVQQGISTLHWAFIKGPAHVKEQLLRFESVLDGVNANNESE
jgi:hypothetical protein